MGFWKKQLTAQEKREKEFEEARQRVRSYLEPRGRRIGSYDSIFSEGDLLAVVDDGYNARFHVFLTHDLKRTITLQSPGYNFQTMQPRPEVLGENALGISVHPPWMYEFTIGEVCVNKVSGEHIGRSLSTQDLQRGIYRVTSSDLITKIMETHQGWGSNVSHVKDAPEAGSWSKPHNF